MLSAAKPTRRDEVPSPDRVVDAIVRGIRSGAYAPGQRLIEADLTRDVGVSRGPVREAFKRLAAEGVLTSTPNRGVYVRAISRSEMRDSLVIVEVLFGLMARLAAKHVGEADNAKRMRQAFDRLWAFKEHGAAAAFVAERQNFYNTIGEISGNQEFGRVLPLMQLHLLRMQFQSYVTPRERERQFKDYQLIAKAILTADARRAERMIKLHTKRTRIFHTRLPDEAFPIVHG